MNHMLQRVHGGLSTLATAEPTDTLDIRAVHRAAADLRRGIPILLRGAESLVLLPAETAGASGLRDFAAVAAEQPILLLARSRARGLGLRESATNNRPDAGVVALLTGSDLLDPGFLRGVADPTSDLMLPEPMRLASTVPAVGDTALALAKLARLLPAMLAARVGPNAVAEADERGLLMVSDANVRASAGQMASELRKVAETRVPLEDAPDARIVAFRAPDSGIEHLAIVVGSPDSSDAPLVRIHSECFTGDLLGSLRCDCGQQLRGAIRRMAEDGAGVLVYLAQEGRGIGLVNKLRAYALQDEGLDTLDANRALGWDADERDFRIAATMLHELGTNRIRLLTNNPQKVSALAACGIAVVREPHAFAPNGVNDSYLATKAARFGHVFD